MATEELVGAIDFGTTFSGWAFMLKHEFESDPTKGYVKQWLSGTAMTDKTPTVVLIKPDGKTLEAFGYDAEDRFKDLIEENKHEGYYYFRRFKMMLNKKLGEKLERNTLLEDEYGKKLPALNVFSMAIEYLVDDMTKFVQERNAIAYEKDRMKWVLTVPAIWTDSAKEFMRTAGEMAGIAPKNLMIALEPEAASIFCRHLNVTKRRDTTGVSIASFKAGDRYIILDAGGGTVDVTVHEVDSSGALKEVVPASGGGWGGTLVDKAFEDLIIKIVGENVYTKFKNTKIEDWLDFWRDFELKKRKINFDKVAKVVLKFPASLSKIYFKNISCSLADRIKNSEYQGSIELIQGRLKLKDTVFKELFSKSLTQITQHIQSLLRDPKVGKIRAILMVGGFSNSQILQPEIKTVCHGVDVIIPLDAESSIMKGAMIFGHSPKCITERVLKYTYGVDCGIEFQEGLHPKKRRVECDSGVYCHQVFSKHVEKGATVKVGEPQVRQEYRPVNYNQTRIHFNIYASDKNDPKYTDEDCQLVGTFDVPFSGSIGDFSRKVWVCFTFSGTEIKVEGEDEKTGRTIEATAKFLG